MTDAEIIKKVIKKRGRFESIDKISQGLAVVSGRNYNQALHIVNQIENMYRKQIGLRQLPIVLLIGVPSFIVGVSLLIIGLASLTEGVSLWGGIRRMQFRAVAIGVGLMLGSLWGMWQAIKKLF